MKNMSIKLSVSNMTRNIVTTFYAIVSVAFISYVHGQSTENLINLNKYHSYGEILRYLENLIYYDKDKIFKVDRIGRTFEGKDLVLVKASSNFDGDKPIILVDAGTHAREWASIAVVLALLEDIRLNKSGLLNYADWYIVPVVNPDGYEYSRNVDRMWRKNRVKHQNSKCYGTDLNRNYNVHWNETGTESDPCDKETYPGPLPFSESETRAMARVMKTYSPRIKLYTSIHASGNYMVYPYGYTEDELPKNWKKLHRFAKNVTDEIFKFNGEKFKVMSAGQWYPAAGGSDDYAFVVIGIPYSFTIELTDEKYKFQYPESLLHLLVAEASVLFKACGVLIHKEFGGKKMIKLYGNN